MTNQNEKPLPREHEYARKELEQGKCGFGLFRGQTFFWIPVATFDAIGKEKILEIIRGVFTESELEQFHLEPHREEISYFFELPSAYNVDDGGNIVRNESKIQKLISMVDEKANGQNVPE